MKSSEFVWFTAVILAAPIFAQMSNLFQLMVLIFVFVCAMITIYLKERENAKPRKNKDR